MQWQRKPGAPAAGPPERPYPEWTVRITIFAVILGVLATVASVYSGLKMAMVLGASAAAVTLGMPFKAFRGSILEVNIGQLIASTISSSAAGVIFTVPALYIITQQHPDAPAFSLTSAFVAAVAGALVGATVITPLRRRFIEIDALPFPSGTANATLVRAPGIPLGSIAVLIVMALGAAALEVAKHGEHVPEVLPIGSWLGLPAYTGAMLMVSVMIAASGLLAGRGGLPFLLGGAVAYFVVAPIAAKFVLNPEALHALVPTFDPKSGDYAAGVAGVLYPKLLRPVGIGIFLGAAIVGVILSFPVLKSIVRGMRTARMTRSELSPKTVAVVVGAGAIAVFAVGMTELSWWRAALVVLIGFPYLIVANMIVTECSARAAQQPVSGLAFIGAVLTYALAGGNVHIAVFLAAAICSGITQGGDMMDDLKTAHLVGADTWKAQMSQMVTAAIGPVVALVVVAQIAQTVGFGDTGKACVAAATCAKDAAACTPDLAALKGQCLAAPQASALAAILDGLGKGGFPYHVYGIGAILGALVTLLPIGGAGVLFGIAFYLPLMMTLAFGVGCLVRIIIDRVASPQWVDRFLVPAAAGLILGESLVGTYYALMVARAAAGGG